MGKIDTLRVLDSHTVGRPHLDAWAAKRLRTNGADALLEYQRQKNVHSIDGLPAVELPDVAASRE
jgi:hypothetical protein